MSTGAGAQAVSGTGGPDRWGSATDGSRIYVAICNFNRIPYTLEPSGAPATAGSWAALDPATGRILWQVADPNGSFDLGPMTAAGGVVYAPSMAGAPTSKNMFALDAATGQVRWSFAAGGSVNAGAALAGQHRVLGLRLQQPRHPRIHPEQQVLRLLPRRAVTPPRRAVRQGA